MTPYLLLAPNGDASVVFEGVHDGGPVRTGTQGRVGGVDATCCDVPLETLHLVVVGELALHPDKDVVLARLNVRVQQLFFAVLQHHRVFGEAERDVFGAIRRRYRIQDRQCGVVRHKDGAVQRNRRGARYVEVGHAIDVGCDLVLHEIEERLRVHDPDDDAVRCITKQRQRGNQFRRGQCARRAVRDVTEHR